MKERPFWKRVIGNATKINDLIALAFVEMQYGFFCTVDKGDWEPSKEHFEKGIKHSEEAKHGS